MTTLWLATCQAWPNLPDNLTPFVQQLEAQGVKVLVAPWQEWQQADWVLPLCAWDYASYSDGFRAWLMHLAEKGMSVFNPLELVQWNMSKDYLLDLAKVVEVIPTIVLDAPNPETFLALIHQKSWSEVVLKPLIGQSGKAVTKWQAMQQTSLPDFSCYSSGLIVQPYIQEIEQYGETSMVFFNGEFSHAVKRQPPVGEWRANSAYGVEVFAITPSEVALASANQVLQSLPVMPMYARVDGTDILEQGHFLLNELEVIEPALYLHTATEATAQFVQTILSKIRKG